MRERKNSELLFDRAKKVMPGGVNSPVRAYQSVSLTPQVYRQGKKEIRYTIEGNEYLDYVGSWGR